jgi:hypothetical protein
VLPELMQTGPKKKKKKKKKKKNLLSALKQWKDFYHKEGYAIIFMRIPSIFIVYYLCQLMHIVVVLLLCVLLPQTLTWIYLGINCLVLHILLNHVAVFVFNNFGFKFL